MAIESSILGVAIGILIGLVLLRYAEISEEIKKGIAIIAAGVMFYFIDLAWTTGHLLMKLPTNITTWITLIWEAVAFILILIGAIYSAALLIAKVE